MIEKQKKEAHTLYVIGNGFDMMHGVPSSYYIFRDSLGKKSDLREQFEILNLKEYIWGLNVQTNVEAKKTSSNRA